MAGVLEIDVTESNCVLVDLPRSSVFKSKYPSADPWLPLVRAFSPQSRLSVPALTPWPKREKDWRYWLSWNTKPVNQNLGKEKIQVVKLVENSLNTELWKTLHLELSHGQ